MATLALWLLGAAVSAGLALACFYLLDRPIRGAARLGSAAHGLAGAVGTALAIWAIAKTAPDPGGMGLVASIMLGLALLGGALVAIAQLSRRRPPGLLVVLHATMAVGGFVILLAWRGSV